MSRKKGVYNFTDGVQGKYVKKTTGPAQRPAYQVVYRDSVCLTLDLPVCLLVCPFMCYIFGSLSVVTSCFSPVIVRPACVSMCLCVGVSVSFCLVVSVIMCLCVSLPVSVCLCVILPVCLFVCDCLRLLDSDWLPVATGCLRQLNSFHPPPYLYTVLTHRCL